MSEHPVLSDRLKRHVVRVCAGCDECEPLDGAPPSRFPCPDSPSMNGAEVVLAEEHEAEVERLCEALVVLYREMPLPVATVCDELIDRSGRLLGEIRHAARNARALDDNDAKEK